MSQREKEDRTGDKRRGEEDEKKEGRRGEGGRRSNGEEKRQEVVKADYSLRITALY